MRKIWTKEEIQYLRDHYPNKSCLEVAAALGRTITSVYPMANMLGIRKTDEYMKSAASGKIQPGQKKGNSFRFPKGHASWNKGLKLGSDWGGENAKRTRFKKGNLSSQHTQ